METHAELWKRLEAEQMELKKQDEIEKYGRIMTPEEKERINNFLTEYYNTPKPKRIYIPSWKNNYNEGTDNRSEEEYKRNH